MALLVGLGPSLPAEAGKPGGGGGGGGPAPSGRFTCRASVARVEPAGLLGVLNPIELFVANPGGDPCVDDEAGLLNGPVVVDLGPTLTLSADLLISRTDGGQQGFANAGVTNLSLEVLGLTIAAEVLTAEATAGPCPGTGLQSESTVARVIVTGPLGVIIADVPVGQNHVEIPLAVLGLGVLTLHLNETIPGTNKVTQRALWLESDLIGDVIVGEAIADVHGNPCGRPPKPPRTPDGFMTGGGSIESAAGRVTHGAHLMCKFGDRPNNLQVNWPGHRFHLEAVTSSSCTDDPTISPGNPAANFDTHRGTGTGRCNGVSGFNVEWKLTDAGEPGRSDRFEFKVLNGGAGCALDAAGFLTGGNHQAHSKG